MKKLIIAITTVLMLASAPAMAQVFLDDDDQFDNRTRLNEGDLGVMVPSQNVEIDQYVPVGEGILLLAGLAGAYLVGKRRKEE